MARLTITLTDERHRALKETAARRGVTLGRLIEESLELCGVKTTEEAASVVARARANARLPEREATDLALRETREVRGTR